MRDYLGQVFPFGVMLAFMAGATLFFGSDTPLSVYFFSGALLLVASIGLALRSSRVVPQSAFLAMALLLLFMVIDGLQGNLINGMPDYAALAAGGAVFLTGRAAALRSKSVGPVWNILTAMFLVLALWAFLDFMIHPGTIHGRPRPYHLDRLSAAFLSANTAGTFFGVGLLVAAAGLMRALTKVPDLHPISLVEGLFRHGAFSLAAFILCGICLVLTASRAGIAFALLCTIILFFWQTMASRRNAAAEGRSMGGWIMMGGLAGLGLVVALFFGLSGDMAAERYGELGEDSNMRVVMFSAYSGAVSAHPLFGLGFGSFEQINNSLMDAGNAHILSGQGAAHNILLQWLLQKGVAGTLAMWGVIGLILWRIRQGLAQRRRFRTYMRSVLIISLFVVLHGQVDYALEIPGFMWWWCLILGIGAGIAAGQSDRHGLV